MIKQLFNVKLLGAVLLSAFVMIAVSNFNSINAQISSSIDTEVESTPQIDLDQLKSQLKSIVEDVKNNMNLTDAQQGVRIVLYKNVWKYARRGADLEQSIDLGWHAARDYVSGLNDSSSVDVKALRNEARNNLL